MRRGGRFGAEADAELAERSGRAKTPERTSQHRASTRRVEGRQRVQVAGGVDDQVRHTTGEEIKSLSEPALRALGPAGDCRDDAQLASRQPHDAAGLTVVEGVEDDRLGLDHRSNLSPA